MGDTLTHLPDETSIARMLAGLNLVLTTGAMLVLRYRDMTHALTGSDRILPLRADENRIFTCFLEYLPDHVNVHDVLHVRTAGGWQTLKSAFAKLRLAPERANAMLAHAGFVIVKHETVQGLVTTVATAARAAPNRSRGQPVP
jgi:hypothetical protein